MKRVRILRDTSGASVVIALVFFLICGIIGSVVMTAASVQAKAAQTHVDLQQKEYAMQSAAKLMAQQLGGEDAVWEEKSVVVKIAYDTAGEASVDTVSYTHLFQNACSRLLFANARRITCASNRRKSDACPARSPARSTCCTCMCRSASGCAPIARSTDSRSRRIVRYPTCLLYTSRCV